jgi:hypothetical protein
MPRAPRPQCPIGSGRPAAGRSEAKKSIPLADLTGSIGILAILLLFALGHGAASAADTPKNAADASSPAAEFDEFERAFLRESALTLHFRSYYLDRKQPNPPGPAAWAAGGWLGYQSGWLGNVLRVGLTGYTSQPLWAPADRDGSLLLKPGQQGYAVLGEANVQLKFWDQEFTVHRQRVDLPEVNPYDIRMTPQRFEGYTLAGRVRDVGYFVGYLDKMKPINSDRFFDFAAVAGAPPGVSEPMWLGGLSYNPVKDFTARLSSYHVPNILTSTYADFVWLRTVSSAVALRLGGQFMAQGSAGGNLLTGSSFDTWSGGTQADLILGPLTASIAYTQTGTGAAYRTPYGGWAGYTSMILQDFNRAGETAWLVGAALDLAGAGLPGLSFFTNAVSGRNAIDSLTGARLSDNNEYDLTLDYRFVASHWPEHLRPLWIRARAVRLEEKLNGNTSVTRDYRIIVNYEWVFKYR